MFLFVLRWILNRQQNIRITSMAVVGHHARRKKHSPATDYLARGCKWVMFVFPCRRVNL